MNLLTADLHIHTCLSPCAEGEMTPRRVVRRALEVGLDLIAICDHNSSENVGSVRRAAEDTGLSIVSGMEITSREEVHVVGLFGDDRALHSAQEVVYDHLPGENDPDIFGEQRVMDAGNRVLRQNPKLLIGATDLALEVVVQTIREVGGIAIASHIDRPSFSLLSQLGFIPEGLGLDGVEVCLEDVPSLPKGLAVIRSSDAHRLEEIGLRRTRLLVEQATYTELQMALNAVEGRGIVTES